MLTRVPPQVYTKWFGRLSPGLFSPALFRAEQDDQKELQLGFSGLATGVIGALRGEVVKRAEMSSCGLLALGGPKSPEWSRKRVKIKYPYTKLLLTKNYSEIISFEKSRISHVISRKSLSFPGDFESANSLENYENYFRNNFVSEGILTLFRLRFGPLRSWSREAPGTHFRTFFFNFGSEGPKCPL